MRASRLPGKRSGETGGAEAARRRPSVTQPGSRPAKLVSASPSGKVRGRPGKSLGVRESAGKQSEAPQSPSLIWREPR